MSLGTPTGRSRIAAAPIEELPEPPIAAVPCTRPSSNRRPSTTPAPRPMTSTARPRSAWATSAVVGAGRLRHLLAGHVGLQLRLPEHPHVHEQDLGPGLPHPVAHVLELATLR